ncbi:amidohydrolase family protein [Luteimonas marina]|uniref:Amidohydrolase family protein n=1 Tax=Luteimonas marina TaxID=488485 RepID=A0A5C5U8N6_9GAMM|nr:amidohydrolase family protein [Luteimonas marina]TWT22313.1 amidohydrolase family protein [Luteimonas marina]
MRGLLLVLACLLLPAARAADSVAIVHARAHPVSAPVVEDATVVLRAGRIVSIEAGGAPPPGARIVDAGGRDLTPGLFHAATRIGLSEVGDGQEAVASGGSRAGYTTHHAIDANAQSVEQARADGVSRALVAPAAASDNVFAGRATLLHLRSGGDIVERSGDVVQFAYIGTDASRAHSHAAAWQRLHGELGRARTPPAHADDPARVDADDLARHEVAMRRTPLAIVADREADIREAIALARTHRLRVVVVGGAEAWRLAPELAAAGIAVVLDPLDALPATYDRLGARHDNAALLHRAGVDIAFTASAQGIYTSWNAGPSLRLAAGIAAAHGLPDAAALAAITQAPARIWGLDARIGTLAPGADADLVLWDGDPLEPASAPVAVFMAGDAVPLRTRQTLLRDRYLPARARAP